MPLPSYAKPPSVVSAGGYQTQLSPQMQPMFDQWVQANNVPYDPSPTSDYDMPGFYAAMRAGDPRTQTGVNQNDGQLHYPDYWKTPYHESFSNESKFAAPGAPMWNDQDQLELPSGKVAFDEKKNALVRALMQKPQF